MSALQLLTQLLARVRRLAASRSEQEFTCGDCERWERCGEPPHADCVARLTQASQRSARTRRFDASL